MDRFYYFAKIRDFLQEGLPSVLGKLALENSFELTEGQRDAWQEEIALLQGILSREVVGEGDEILFEYSIPRLGKRVDVVLLLGGVVFVLEFKVGAREFLRKDLEQVWDYALDLKNFHEASQSLTIVPILVATEASEYSETLEICRYADRVFAPLCANAASLETLLKRILDSHGSPGISWEDWAFSRYCPTPTIIQAASALYLHHNVSDITRSEASGASLQATSEFVMRVIDHSCQNREKSICFVTGVPGAGKTLVGLNVAVQQFERKNLAVYLSGNKPLVDVLTEALARDKQRQEQQKNPGKRYNKSDAQRDVKSFIQIVHHYRNTTLTKLKSPIREGQLEIDPNKVKHYQMDGYSEVEHVAIFDEAQRAWTRQQLAAWLMRKKRIQDFPMSEPEFLIWSLDLREDWAVIVCLVGEGQEIGTGEAGIGEWLRAIQGRFPHWNLFLSPKIVEEWQREGNAPLSRLAVDERLHLAVSMRSYRAENLSHFVAALLEGNQGQARELHGLLKEKFPLVLTRSLDRAKAWLREHARGSERYGMVVSSEAQRLRPLAIDVRCKPNTVHWFLEDEKDIRSSLFLEDAASEFDVQGLELDWVCVVWDGDFRWNPKKGGWDHHSFTGKCWQTIRSKERMAYQVNAYRVLMTRARQGMILCIPQGNPRDDTRLPAFYDGTFAYLKAMGLEEI
ncbi:MAG: DNA/RNA helicase domain-containing protein [Oligosphaeraceae bacterium]